jgi:multidrug efflux pump subunit AcrA (membrane-fusion protein)
MPPFKAYGVLLLLAFIVLSACRGGGGRAPVPLPTTVLTVGAPVSDTVVRDGTVLPPATVPVNSPR